MNIHENDHYVSRGATQRPLKAWPDEALDLLQKKMYVRAAIVLRINSKDLLLFYVVIFSSARYSPHRLKADRLGLRGIYKLP